jgi:hypothetical protein
MKTATAVKAGLLGFAIALFVYCLTIVLMPLTGDRPFVTQSQGKTGVSDFVILYEAGVLAVSPDRQRIYDPAVQLDYCNRLIAPDRLSSPFYLQYPPWFFTLMAPWAVLPFKAAFAVWTVFWLAIAALSLIQLLRLGEITSKLDRSLLIAMALASAPIILSLKLGQTSLWLLSSLCLFCYGWRIKSDKLVALALVLSSIKLQYLFFFVIPCLVWRRWKTIGWAALFGALLLAATAADVGWQSMYTYPSWVSFVEASGSTGVSAESMVNIQGLARAFLGAKTSFLLGVLGFGSALVYLAFTWWRGWRRQDLQNWLLALTVCLGLLTSMHTHFHDCGLIAIAAALTLRNVQLPPRAGTRSYRCWQTALIYYPLLAWLCFVYRQQMSFPVMAVLNVIVAGCAIACCESQLKGHTGVGPMAGAQPE